MFSVFIVPLSLCFFCFLVVAGGLQDVVSLTLTIHAQPDATSTVSWYKDGFTGLSVFYWPMIFFHKTHLNFFFHKTQ